MFLGSAQQQHEQRKQRTGLVQVLPCTTKKDMESWLVKSRSRLSRDEQRVRKEDSAERMENNKGDRRLEVFMRQRITV